MTVYKELAGYELPDWLTIEIVTGSKYKSVIIRSKLHMIKENKLKRSWSLEYTDAEILNDTMLFNSVCGSYGLALVTRLESI